MSDLIITEGDSTAVIVTNNTSSVISIESQSTVITTIDSPSVIVTENTPSIINIIGSGPQGVAGNAFSESSPVFTYVNGIVARIDYASGNYKMFTYTDGVLTQLDYIKGTITMHKTFTYNPDGTLASITETVI